MQTVSSPATAQPSGHQADLRRCLARRLHDARLETRLPAQGAQHLRQVGADVAGKADEILVGEIRKRHLCRLRQPMPHVNHQAQWIARDLAQHDARRRGPVLQAHETDVEFATCKAVELRGGEHFLQLQAHRRKAAAVGVEHIRQQIGEG